MMLRVGAEEIAGEVLKHREAHASGPEMSWVNQESSLLLVPRSPRYIISKGQDGGECMVHHASSIRRALPRALRHGVPSPRPVDANSPTDLDPHSATSAS